MANVPPLRRMSDPTTPTTNENPHIVDLEQRDGHSNTSAQADAPKKLYLTKDLFQEFFVDPKIFTSVQCFRGVDFVLVRCLEIIVLLILLLSFAALAYSCILIVSLAILPLLLVSLLITRIFQFVKCGKDYKKLTHFKHFLRGWLYIDAILVSVGLWLFYPIAKFLPSLKPVIALDLHLTYWVMIITTVCAFYLITFAMYKLTHYLTRICNVRNVNIPQAISEIIDGLLFWWAKHEVMKRVPTFQHHELLGLPTRKWLRVAILLLICYNIITLLTHLLVISLRYICKQCSTDSSNGGFRQILVGKQLHTKYVVHFANGMRLSISFVMNSLMLLLTWIFYFGARLDMNVSRTQSIWELGKWTFTSLFICSFLWLIKSFILLAWEVNTVYLRLESKIKSVSEELYFLGILGFGKHDFFKVHSPDSKTNEQEHGNEEQAAKSCFAKWVSKLSRKFAKSGDKLITQQRERVRSDLRIDKYSTVDDLRKAAHYFVTAQKYLWNKKYISHILSNFKDDYCDRTRWETWTEQNHHEVDPAVKSLKKIFTFNSTKRESNVDEQKPKALLRGSKEPDPKQKPDAQSEAQSNGEQINEWNRFAMLVLGTTYPKDSLSATEFQTWVERAHNRCIFLSNILSSAHEVGSSLNKIISWLLLGAISIMWLLLSGLATTQVLVIIASPLLAATFVFGDSCKTMFQGILFVYVIHPFDVGDLCVIEGKKMVVKAIDIWTTSFSEVDRQSKRKVLVYPNGELASKVILNYKEFDWSDCLEFILGEMEKINLTHQNLIQHFNSCINKGSTKDLLSSSPILTILTKEDSVMLVIHLNYKAETAKGWTYFGCFREKDRLQAEFRQAMKEIIRKFKRDHGLDEGKSNSTKTNDISTE